MMRQQTETEHTLQIRESPHLIFAPVVAGMYQAARRLAADGQIEAALRTAEDIRIENYGHMRGVSFRVITTTRTVSMHGSWAEFDND